MEIPDILVAILSAEPEGINGRTAIQKLGYFVSVELQKKAGYKADFYGPFSSLLAAHLQALVGQDFVEEKKRRTIHDRIMYSYSLTEDGEELAQNVREEYPTEYSIIKNVTTKCGKIGHYNFRVLSWAAKVHFVLAQTGKAMTHREAMEASRLFNWNLDERQIESGARLLSALGLIKTR